MRISTLLHAGTVFPDLAVRVKEEALSLAAVQLSRCCREVDPDRLTGALLQRERLLGTALPDGVAIPHARLPKLRQPIAAFGRSRAGIDWDAQDGSPIHLFFVLVVPADGDSSHLKLLAATSRLLRDTRCRMRLMAAGDDALLDVLRAEEERLSSEPPLALLRPVPARV